MPDWTHGCVDTLHGRIHRFIGDGPCQCGDVIKNRRQHERLIPPDTTYGVVSGRVMSLVERDGAMTVSQMAAALKETKAWVRTAVTRLMHAKKIIKTGERVETCREGGRHVVRTVAIYALPPATAYPEDIHAR